MLAQVLTGLLLAAGIAVTGFRFHALTPSGTLTATLVGTLIFAAGGLTWSALLLTFFVTGSALSRLTRRDPDTLTAKGGRRDAMQVLANGGIPASLALAALVTPALHWVVPYAGALAAANADTWATEIGRLSRSRPRLITTLQPVLPGTSGGITVLGLAASVAGAGTIAFISLIVTARPSDALAVGIAGTLGSLIDSLLGATIQELRRCAFCMTMTEQTVHAPCGTRTDVIAGTRGINNDVVNALASITSALLAATLASL